VISGLNKSALDDSSAIFFDNYAMFFVPNGVDGHNSLVLVWDTQANTNDRGKPHGGWVKFTGWNIARASVFNPSYFFMIAGQEMVKHMNGLAQATMDWQ